ncbi:MAG: hypothetical protein V2I97_07110 [Desulfococcaceae bacterium]|nr:hypothetical protein [Desulfococcaceae bacterium]
MYGDENSFNISQIDKIIKEKNDIVILRSGDRIMGSVQEESINIKTVKNENITVNFKNIKEVTFLENRKNNDCH